MERAVNLGDLTKYVDRGGGLSPIMLLLRPLLTEQVVQCEGDRWDGGAVLVRADVKDEQWQAVKKVLRELKGIPKYALRMYETGKVGNKTWKRV